MDAKMALLLDKQDIQETILRYPWGIDSRDWTLFRSSFADEVEMDFSSYSGTPATRMKAEQWVAACQSLHPGFDATQHVLSNFMIEVDGDDATAIVYMKAEHFLEDDYHTLGGHYTHKLKRHAEGWLIHATTLTVTWRRGNFDVYEKARQRVAEGAAK